jgi:hypothetical protein
MIRLKKLLREADGEINTRELYDEYKKVRELFDTITEFDFFTKLKELDGMTNEFTNKLDAKIESLPEEYNDSDEYYELIEPLYNMVWSIQNFAYWAGSLSNDEKYRDAINKATIESKKIPQESNYNS